jgi:hypothetical protein
VTLPGGWRCRGTVRACVRACVPGCRMPKREMSSLNGHRFGMSVCGKEVAGRAGVFRCGVPCCSLRAAASDLVLSSPRGDEQKTFLFFSCLLCISRLVSALFSPVRTPCKLTQPFAYLRMLPYATPTNAAVRRVKFSPFSATQLLSCSYDLSGLV